MSKRQSRIRRKTKETDIDLTLDLNGTGVSNISTGLGFYDHMLDALTRHGRFDLTLTCKGDLDIDDHHTVEDCALALGSAFDDALGERRGIQRFGFAYAPLDESLARVVIDFSGRPGAWVDLQFTREKIGDVATENLTHVFESFAMTANATLHVDVLRGHNNHHKAEAAFKAFALALRHAISLTGNNDVPSTKGVLK